MLEIGRLCIKTAGRDSGLKCVVIERIDDNYVMIDGQTRRKKCNIKHLEPLNKVLKIKEKASHADVVKALEKEGISVKEKVNMLLTAEYIFRLLHKLEDVSVKYIEFVKNFVEQNKNAVESATARLKYLSKKREEELEKQIREYEKFLKEKFGGGEDVRN